MCVAVGLTSLGTFGATFQRVVGKSPTGYRRPRADAGRARLLHHGRDQTEQFRRSVRWLTVRVPGDAKEILLETPGLVANGVEITQPPTDQPYGRDFGFRDPFGNHLRAATMTAPA